MIAGNVGAAPTQGTKGQDMIWHVIPIDDSIEHIESMDCECIPTFEVMEDNDVFVFHNAMDGRDEERNELVPQYKDIMVEIT